MKIKPVSKYPRYSHCSLSRRLTKEVVLTTAWIPTRFAKVGESLRMKWGSEWESGWLVDSVGETRSEDQIPDPPRLVRRHKKSTGDA